MNSHGLNVIPRTEVNRSDRLLLIRGAETTLFHERRHGIGGLSRNNNVYGCYKTTARHWDKFLTQPVLYKVLIRQQELMWKDRSKRTEKKSDLKKEVLACFCFQLLLSTGANWRFYALVSAIVRIYLQGPVDKGNVSLRPPPLVTVFCRPDFKYYIFLFARKRCWLSLWRNCIIKESNTCHILTTFNSFYQYYFCFIKKMGG